MAIIYSMIIGLILLGSVAVLLFFGIAERVFKSFGVAYWLAFIMVGVLIGSAFIPSFRIGVVTVNAAGFIAPAAFAVVFFVIAVRTREHYRAIVAASAVAASYVAVRLLVEPIASPVVTAIVVGFLCGAIGFLVGKTKLAALASIFAGFPIGEGISTAVGAFLPSVEMRLGSAAMFDALIIAAVFSVAMFEAIAAIKRTMNARRTAVLAETAEEFDPDEYKRYFDE